MPLVSLLPLQPIALQAACNHFPLRVESVPMNEHDPFDPFEDPDEESEDSFEPQQEGRPKTPAKMGTKDSTEDSREDPRDDSTENPRDDSTDDSTVVVRATENKTPSRPDSGGGRFLYQATTAEVRVTVRPVFLDDQSEPEAQRYLWAYHIRIENGSTETVQLLTRHWEITDSDGKLHTVEGAGVVGEQPTLAPGGSFEYTSGTPLRTPSGFMAGCYEMRRQDGARFRVQVPAFSLDSPYAEAHLLH